MEDMELELVEGIENVKGEVLNDKCLAKLWKHAEDFEGVKSLVFVDGKITEVTGMDLGMFPGLRYVNLRGNPLSESSKAELQLFQLNHPEIVVLFDQDSNPSAESMQE